MKRESIERRVIDILSYTTQTDRNNIKLSTNLFADLGVDSLDFLEIITEIEKVFGVELKGIPNKFFDETSSVKGIVDEVERALNENVAIRQVQEEKG